MVLCGGLLAFASWWRDRGASTPADLVALLPERQGTLLYIDVAALREGGLLGLIAGSKSTQDLEYSQFVQRSGFDYLSDLEGVAALVTKETNYFVLRGRFDWRKIIAYANSAGGQCRLSFCRVPATQPDRFITFLPIRNDVMALAVSADSWAAEAISSRPRDARPQLPAEPVWILAPGAVFQNLADPPPGTRAFVAALAEAERTVFAIGPSGDRLQMTVEIACQSPSAAAKLRDQLAETTGLLRKMLERENQKPNPADFSGLLAGGSFEQRGALVFGRWPMETAFIENLAGGTLQ